MPIRAPAGWSRWSRRQRVVSKPPTRLLLRALDLESGVGRRRDGRYRLACSIVTPEWAAFAQCNLLTGELAEAMGVSLALTASDQQLPARRWQNDASRADRDSHSRYSRKPHCAIRVRNVPSARRQRVRTACLRSSRREGSLRSSSLQIVDMAAQASRGHAIVAAMSSHFASHAEAMRMRVEDRRRSVLMAWPSSSFAVD